MSDRVVRNGGVPRRAFPAPVADWLRPELSSIAEEMIAAIRHEVPAYSGPMEGKFAAGLRRGVEQGLRHFVEIVANPSASREYNAKVFWKLGCGELREGRSLDALQAAFWVGAQVAWRRYGRIAQRAGFSIEVTSMLAEAVFAHVNHIASLSLKGYREAQTSAATERQRLRKRLLELMLAEPPVSLDVLADLAQRAQWPLPETVACVALEFQGRDISPYLPSLPPSVLMSAGDSRPYLVLPEPETPGREAALREVLRGQFAVLGPTVPLRVARRSLCWARRTLELVQRGAIPRKQLVTCADHLGPLLLLNDEHLAQLLAGRTVKTFESLTSLQRNHMRSTLYAWLISTGRSAPEVATILGIHPQTARYRLRRLTELFGDRLQDPDFRFELEAAMRAQGLLAERDHTNGH